ncbi:MAG: cache domain-containing protein [Hormoscilla sp.]
MCKTYEVLESDPEQEATLKAVTRDIISGKIDVSPSDCTTGELPRLKIANQLRTSFLLLAVFSSLLAGGLLTRVSFQTQWQQSIRLQEERSKSAAHEIEVYLDDLQGKLNYLALVRGLTELSGTAQQKLLEAMTRHNEAYEIVALLNPRGEVVASASPHDNLSLNVGADSPLFLRPFQHQEDYVSPVEIDPVLGLHVVNLAVPVRNDRDLVDGVLVARINLEFLWFVVSQADLGSTGYAYIIDNRLQLIAQKGSSPETAQLQDLSAREFILDLTKGMLTGQQTVRKYQGLRGVEVLGAIAPVPRVNWRVIVELPVTEVYGPVRQAIGIILLTLVFVILVAGALGIFFSYKIVSPLQRLTAAAIDISSGDLDIQVQIEERNEMWVLANTFNEMTLQLRQLIAEVKEERNFASAVIETAGALIVVLDLQGRIIRFNHTCERTTGYSFSEVRDRHFWDFFLVPEETEAVMAVFEDLQVGTFGSEYENYWLTKDGDRRLISWSNTALQNSEGEINYIISIGIDVTEQKQAEELRKAKETVEGALRKLQQTQAQLIQSEKMASLGQMVAGIAHEINNPTSFIYGNITPAKEYAADLMNLLELYQLHYPEPDSEIAASAEAIDLEYIKEDFPKLLYSMQMGADRIRAIVLSLRNFSRLDESDMKHANLHEGIDNTLLILHHKLKPKDGKVEIEVIKEYGLLPEINCYPSQLNQVFMHIIGNAIDALHSQGDRKDRSPTITIRTELRDKKWAIARIADNGPGMTTDVLNKIFDPFFTTKPVGSGTGLGLSISYQIIVDKHGGKLNCISSPGKGTEFIIKIPIAH